MFPSCCDHQTYEADARIRLVGLIAGSGGTVAGRIRDEMSFQALHRPGPAPALSEAESAGALRAAPPLPDRIKPIERLVPVD